MYALIVTFCDVTNSGFVKLGGAAWTTREEQLAQRNAIPAAKGRTCFVHDEALGVERDKYITAETVEVLMGEPIATLIERGRKNTCLTLEQLKAKLAGAGYG